MDPDEARRLMHEWTRSPALRIHMECVAACMDAYAGRLEPAEIDRWLIAGLLHDFDYERFPNPTRDPDNGHPATGVRHLVGLGVDEEICTAIMAHADYTGQPRTTPMARVLFGVDELAGFIVACAKVRPDGVATLKASSVRKKLRDKSFAAAVSREDIGAGAADIAQLFGIYEPAEFEPQHIQTCIDAIRSRAAHLGLLGPAAT